MNMEISLLLLTFVIITDSLHSCSAMEKDQSEKLLKKSEGKRKSRKSPSKEERTQIFYTDINNFREMVEQHTGELAQSQHQHSYHPAGPSSSAHFPDQGTFNSGQQEFEQIARHHGTQSLWDLHPDPHAGPSSSSYPVQSHHGYQVLSQDPRLFSHSQAIQTHPQYPGSSSHHPPFLTHPVNPGSSHVRMEHRKLIYDPKPLMNESNFQNPRIPRRRWTHPQDPGPSSYHPPIRTYPENPDSSDIRKEVETYIYNPKPDKEKDEEFDSGTIPILDTSSEFLYYPFGTDYTPLRREQPPHTRL